MTLHLAVLTMTDNHRFDPASFAEIFVFSDEVDDFIADSLVEFNARRIKLFDLPAYQRIFLFILTRSIKTFSSILILCRSGFGQDVSTLMRSLLENLITARYIVHDRTAANTLAKRFVAYKWVIFKRQLPEQEMAARHGTDAEKNAFLERKNMILGKVQEFKDEFSITSDRALITWSGKSVRDMARKVNRTLLEEYEKTFRLCSRFSHPSILGDNEYLIQNDNQLTFSPQPSAIGIVSNLHNAITYALDFISVTDELFQLGKRADIDRLLQRNDALFKIAEQGIPGSADNPASKPPAPSLRDTIVTFQKRSQPKR